MISFEEILEITKLHKSRIHNIYVFGSRVYGTYNDQSDYDLLVIANTPHIEKEYKHGHYNIHVMTMDRFMDGLRVHNIRNIECIMAPEEYRFMIRKEIPYEFNHKGFKHSIIHSSNFSFDKAKKRLGKDRYLAMKSLFHSIRIMAYGNQILNHGSIKEWSEVNHYYDMIMGYTGSDEELITIISKVRSELIHEFLNKKK